MNQKTYKNKVNTLLQEHDKLIDNMDNIVKRMEQISKEIKAIKKQSNMSYTELTAKK